MVHYYVIIPVAGSGTRFGSAIPKQYTLINGITLLQHTLNAFLRVDRIRQIILIASPHDKQIDKYNLANERVIIHKVGGATRAQSVLNGLNMLSCHNDDWVLVHDAARCCITPHMINKLIENLNDNAVGGILASQATDTIKYVVNGTVQSTVKRENIYLAQTPQMFRYKILLDAMTKVDLTSITDEASAVEQLGLHVQIVNNASINIKVTYPQDLVLAEILLRQFGE